MWTRQSLHTLKTWYLQDPYGQLTYYTTSSVLVLQENQLFHHFD